MSDASEENSKRHYVHHEYHDHAFDVDGSEEVKVDGGFKRQHHRIISSGDEQDHLNSVSKRVKRTTDRKGRGMRGGVAVPFPEKLHRLLSSVEQQKLSHIVSWQPHGRCFVVHKPKQFVERILPKFFRQTKITSFQRQLNLYSFQRLTSGPDRGGYYHEYFLKGREFLCKNMVRTRIKGTGCKAAASPQEEPNFYDMPLLSKEDNAIELRKESKKGSSFDSFENDALNSVTGVSMTNIAASRDDKEPESIPITRQAEYPRVVEPDEIINMEITPPNVSSFDDESTASSISLRVESSDSLVEENERVTREKPTAMIGCAIVTPTMCRKTIPDHSRFPDELRLTECSIKPQPLVVESSQYRPPLPNATHQNDEVYFEGQRFHYLDPSGLDFFISNPLPPPMKLQRREMTRTVSLDTRNRRVSLSTSSSCSSIRQVIPKDIFCEPTPSSLRLFVDDDNAQFSVEETGDPFPVADMLLRH